MEGNSMSQNFINNKAHCTEKTVLSQNALLIFKLPNFDKIQNFFLVELKANHKSASLIRLYNRKPS